MSVARFLGRCTTDQWSAIDRTFRTREPLRRRVAVVLLFTTAVLIALQYLGKSHVVTGIPGVASLLSIPGYPDLGGKLYWAGFRLLVYFGLPVFLIRAIFHERLADYGLRIDPNPRILLLYAGLFLAVFPLVFLASFSEGFINKYPFSESAGISLRGLIAWEAAYGLQFFALEFFFRGFLLVTLARAYGAGAIFIMVVPYTMIHFSKPLAETIGAVIAGVALGTLALRTRSIFGGVAVHTAVGWSMDLFALYQKNQLP